MGGGMGSRRPPALRDALGDADPTMRCAIRSFCVGPGSSTEAALALALALALLGRELVLSVRPAATFEDIFLPDLTPNCNQDRRRCGGGGTGGRRKHTNGCPRRARSKGTASRAPVQPTARGQRQGVPTAVPTAKWPLTSLLGSALAAAGRCSWCSWSPRTCGLSTGSDLALALPLPGQELGGKLSEWPAALFEDIFLLLTLLPPLVAGCDQDGRRWGGGGGQGAP